jgi:hypothetical protein
MCLCEIAPVPIIPTLTLFSFLAGGIMQYSRFTEQSSSKIDGSTSGS